MANLTHLFKVGQAVKVKADTYDNTLYNGTVKETHPFANLKNKVKGD